MNYTTVQLIASLLILYIVSIVFIIYDIYYLVKNKNKNYNEKEIIIKDDNDQEIKVILTDPIKTAKITLIISSIYFILFTLAVIYIYFN